MIYKPTTPKIYTPQDKSCVLNLDPRDVRGSKIYDRSGKGNHGAITGAVLKPRNYGIPVLEFDGIIDYVNVADNASLNITNTITVSAWVKAIDVSTHKMIVDKSDAAALAYGYRLMLHPTGNSWKFMLGDGSPHYVDGNIPLFDVWQHIVGTYDGSVIRLYENGIEIDNSNWGGTIDFTGTDNIRIGKDTSGTKHFNGSIGETLIYNRALSASEVSKMFNKSRHSFGI